MDERRGRNRKRLEDRRRMRKRWSKLGRGAARCVSHKRKPLVYHKVTVFGLW